MQGRQGRGRRERTFVRDRGREPQATPQMPVQTRRIKVNLNGQMQGRRGRGRRERTFVRDLVREPMATPQMPVQIKFKRMTWAVAA